MVVCTKIDIIISVYFVSDSVVLGQLEQAHPRYRPRECTQCQRWFFDKADTHVSHIHGLLGYTYKFVCHSCRFHGPGVNVSHPTCVVVPCATCGTRESCLLKNHRYDPISNEMIPTFPISSCRIANTVIPIDAPFLQAVYCCECKLLCTKLRIGISSFIVPMSHAYVLSCCDHTSERLPDDDILGLFFYTKQTVNGVNMLMRVAAIEWSMPQMFSPSLRPSFQCNECASLFIDETHHKASRCAIIAKCSKLPCKQCADTNRKDYECVNSMHGNACAVMCPFIFVEPQLGVPLETRNATGVYFGCGTCKAFYLVAVVLLQYNGLFAILQSPLSPSD